MIVYNVTIQVNWEIHDEWIPWIKQVHIPEILSTKQFTHHTMLKLLEVDETDGPTYVIQYFAANRENYEYYLKNYASALIDKSNTFWPNQYYAFRTIMEVVN